MSIAKQERDAVLWLTKFFGNYWNIVDVGANKGAWSDVLIDFRDSSDQAGKYTVHLCEPNQLLLNYLTVKYDYNDNVALWDYAISNTENSEKFYKYGLVRNSGLSGLLYNEKWDKELGGFDPIDVRCRTLDWLCNQEVDIIKIDIEGAEYKALTGASGLLESKRVKFIQVEYSEHYKLMEVGFKDVMSYAAMFGYSAWSWTGEEFIKLDNGTFVEDYRAENFILTYKDISKYSREYIDFQYTQLWNSEFKQSVVGLEGTISLALEIGSFEGLTSNYICDHLLKRGEGRLICVDPLEDRYLPTADEVTNAMFVGQYERFINNTRDQPIELMREGSRTAFPKLVDYLFDFVYIDGDHNEEEVFLDGVWAIRMLRRGGHILFDDYGWSEGTARGIDRFIAYAGERILVVKKGYQVLIKLRRWDS